MNEWMLTHLLPFLFDWQSSVSSWVRSPTISPTIVLAMWWLWKIKTPSLLPRLLLLLLMVELIRLLRWCSCREHYRLGLLSLFFFFFLDMTWIWTLWWVLLLAVLMIMMSIWWGDRVVNFSLLSTKYPSRWGVRTILFVRNHDGRTWRGVRESTIYKKSHSEGTTICQEEVVELLTLPLLIDCMHGW